MKDFVKGFIGLVSSAMDQFGVYKSTLVLFSIIFFVYDFYQLFNPTNQFLTIVGFLCLIISAGGQLGVLRLRFEIYGFAVLVPIFVLLAGVFYNDQPAFELSALGAAMSALIPTLGAAFITFIIELRRAFVK